MTKVLEHLDKVSVGFINLKKNNKISISISLEIISDPHFTILQYHRSTLQFLFIGTDKRKQ